ncbi:TRP-domain-containing protein [Marasmius fiardii PR-910]|nr:TRP-domain-containing protein [Marasmius fiardii PR-910]
MFFSTIARLRILALLFTTFLLFPSAVAQGDRLFTSSVTYCQPPESLLIQQFDVAYFARNRSVSFNITASSVLPDVSVSANLLLNVYGMKPVNLTLDLCKVLSGALCPLPIQEFHGQDSLTIPDSFSSRIPAIAYKIPDLEAYAQLMLTETDTGRIRACVQATLSNGWSTHQTAVEWSTGGVAIATLLAAIWQSTSPDTPIPFRLIDLLSFYQSIAATAFLNLNYPSLYRSFALNFGWAMSLFTSSSDSVQNAIDNMRARTGGNLANSTSDSPVGLVNRKLSPWNANVAQLLGDSSTLAIPEVPRSFLTTVSNMTVDHSSPLSDLRLHQLASTGDDSSGAVQTVTQDSSNVLQAGIPIYANSLHIATANAFMTVFICTLILIAITIFLFVVGYGALYVMERLNLGHGDNKLKLKYSYPSFVRAWSLRLALVMFSPIMVFCMYQWTLKDSWLSILLSVISFVAIIIGVGCTCLIIFRRRRSSDSDGLYDNIPFLLSHGPILAQYRTQRYYFSVFYVISAFMKALFIAAAKSQGLAQVVLILLVEIATLLGILVLRPHKTRGGDVFTSFLATIRVICAGLLFAFVERFNVQAIPRVVIGVVIAVIFSVSIIIMVINIVLNIGFQRLWRRGQKKSDKMEREDSADNILEKGAITSTISDADSVFTRARNPTPDRNVPLDRSVLQPYPATPSTATSPTDYSSNIRDSASTNFGTLLPRRWSITPLQSPTSSSNDHSPSTAAPQAINSLGRTPEESSQVLPPAQR